MEFVFNLNWLNEIQPISNSTETNFSKIVSLKDKTIKFHIGAFNKAKALLKS